jgi:molybdate transport system regulatory protein
MKVKSKVWLEKEGQLVFGAGRASILRAVEETGSLNAAAKKLDMSYRRLWSHITASEKRLGRELVVRNKGGKGGGGAQLTGFAQELLVKYGELERAVVAFTDNRYREVFS